MTLCSAVALASAWASSWSAEGGSADAASEASANAMSKSAIGFMLPSYARSWFKSRLAFSRQSRCAFDSTFGLHASLRGKAPPILERLNRRGDFQHRIPHGRQPVAFVGLRKQFRFHHAQIGRAH